MKTEYIQTIMAIVLVAVMVAFMVMQPQNKTLYVTFPLKDALQPDMGQKIVQQVLRYGYEIQKNNANTNNCIIVSKEITNSICFSGFAIRIETVFKSGELSESGFSYEPTNDESAVRFNNLKVLESQLLAVFQQNAVQHHPAEYSW